ncbi:MAG: hypothetical protein WC941_10260, partial [Candidatus Bathyarchaeia archaeon]
LFAMRLFLGRAGPRPLSVPDVSLALFLSVALLAIISTVLALASSLRVLVLSGIIDGVTTAAGLYAMVVLRKQSPEAAPRPSAWSLLGLLAVVIGAAGLFVVWHQGTPYPSNAGWDYITFIVQVEHLQLYGGFAYVIIPSYPPGGVPYPGMFMDLLGGLTVYLGVNPFDLFWWGTFPMLLGFMAVIYALVFHYSTNPLLAVAVAFAGVFLGAAQGEVVRNPLYLTVDMTTQILFLLAVLWFVETNVQGRDRSLAILLMASFLGVFYFYVLLPTFPLFVAMIVGLRRLRVLGSPLRVFLVANLALLSILALLSVAPASLIGRIVEFVPSSFFPLDQKATLLADIYVPIFWIALASAAVVYSFHSRGVSREPLSLTHFAIGTSFLLVAYFMPVWITYRFEFYMRSYVLIFLAALTLGPISLRWPRAQKRPPPMDGPPSRTNRPSPRVKWAIAIVVLAVLPTVALYPLYERYTQGYTAWYSTDEYVMGQWIQKNLPADAFLATDPGTAYYTRALAFRNSSVYFILPDGRAPTAGLGTESDLNLKLFTAFHAVANISLAWTEFRSLGFPETYVLISTRTPIWLLGNGQQWLSHPANGTGVAYWVQFFQPPYFTLLYRTGDVYLFAVRP